jgi:hypothetical protein
MAFRYVASARPQILPTPSAIDLTTFYTFAIVQSGLVEPGRKMQREGDINYHKSTTSKAEAMHAFLLSDLFLIVQCKSARFEYKLWVSLDDCRLIVLADSYRMC